MEINLNEEKLLLIDGKWKHSSSQERMSIINPYNGSVITSVAKATKQDVHEAYEAAANAFPAWYKLGVKGRTSCIREFMLAIQQNKEQLARVDTLNSGNPIKGMLRDMDMTVNRVDRTLQFAANVQGFTSESSGNMNLHYTRFEPYGVVARIVPFNHPLMFAATKIIAPLIMGNTVILKPSDFTPLSALAIGEWIKDIFPPGVINIITGDANAGQAIISHPQIKRIGFTGSTNTGKRIMKSAAEVGIKHISMELGGKNPMIIFPDADIDQAVSHSLRGMGYGSTTGQSCGSNSRIFVHQDIYEEYVDKLRDATSRLVLGNPLNHETDIGPLINEVQMSRVLQYIEIAKSEGCEIIEGGIHPMNGPENKGFFVTPAIITGAKQHMRISHEEVFGPITSLMKWNDYNQMIVDVNATEYGLTASIWTKDLKNAHLTANKVEAGYIWINNSAKHFEGMPFGGYKNSGLGREESLEELKSYCETKVVNVMIE